MEKTGFAVFKYKHAGPAGISDKRLKVCKFSAIAGLVMVFIFFPVGAALLVLALGAWLTAPKCLSLGPRYLICGDRIVYYGNVRKIDFELDAGRLTLQPTADIPFVIEQENFPTNARKSHKIAANKAAKFSKVSGKLIEKIRQASPSVELSGISQS
jgi:hypothetical protein